MKIIVAKTAGFCMGVKRVVDLALENAGRYEHDIKTIGPIIHNKQTIDMLKERGIAELDMDSIPSTPQTLLIRAHGIPPNLQKDLAQKSHVIIDGTCPKVKTVHRVIERYQNQGYAIIITGDQGHAEVIGLLGYAGKSGHLIATVEDVDKLPDFKKVCLVSQTTFDRTVFDHIAEKIKLRYGSAETIIKKTICAATDQRQSETQQMANQVDAMIVVGGKNSANTQRLYKISLESGKPTQLVETETEINWEILSPHKTVGITAGASTPNWMIKRVTDYLQFMDKTRKHTVSNILQLLFDTIANLNIMVALGAVAMYYVSCILQGYTFSPGGALLAFLYFLSMYLWNSVTSIETTQHLNILRYRFYHYHKKWLFTLAGICIIALLILSFSLGQMVLYLMLCASIAGSVYHVTIVPSFLRSIFKYKNLKDIPSSRDLFVALAWATVLTFIPQAMNNAIELQPMTIAAFCWIFVLAFLRSLIFDLRDIEGDRILGRETLITIVGEKRARKAIYLIIIACVITLALAPSIAGLTTYLKNGTLRFSFQVPVLLYAAFFVKLNPGLRSSAAMLFTIFADGLFYLAGLGALCAAKILQ